MVRPLYLAWKGFSLGSSIFKVFWIWFFRQMEFTSNSRHSLSSRRMRLCIGVLLLVQFTALSAAPGLAQRAAITKTGSDKSTNPTKSNSPTITFATKARVSFAGSNLKPFKFKPWTAKEKSAVTAIIDRLGKRAPGFLKLVESTASLKFVRATEVLADGKPTAAVTLDDAIVLSDDFFRSSASREQFHILVHELVHQSDFYWYMAHSKSWVLFAYPKICAPPPQSPSDQQKWLTDHARFNLVEALAEYITYYVEKPQPATKASTSTSTSTNTNTNPNTNTSSHKEEPMVSVFLHPTQKHLFWNRCLSNGALLMFNGKYESARAEFDRAIAIAPEGATAYMLAAQASAYSQDVTSAISYMTKFLSITNADGVPESERVRYQAIGRVNNAIGTAQHRKEFIAALSKSFPNELVLQRFQQAKTGVK